MTGQPPEEAVGNLRTESATMFPLSELEAAAKAVHRDIPPTPQYCWPLLSRRVGCEVWVKHENHTPTGAFKVRGGIVYVGELHRREPDATGLVAATRGNHGQSLAFAARLFGLKAVVVVPHGNCEEKNAAMPTTRPRAPGAAALAAAMKERALLTGKRIALVLSGGNVDRKVFAQILAGE